ncbi:putative DNA modification/repair radical SAM protein [Anaerovorax odorimutans]|uniref:putative DNA modification/repair radical SAM protein n=1 Tax=Anaerovorax odorimutans TaxID=109327 RepID=UPI00040121DB|nr:putative DNA modification/repair radical SAM protein [Anaerovorax odorimutans]
MDNVYEKLKILADSAKYDVSCSTSGVDRKNTGKRGNAVAAGICHSWSSDGRCVSLLKILFTNKCVYDCQYCVNRRTEDVQRASFEPEELAKLTMEFYRRNYIEGLFLSSAVEISPDYTAERMLKCLKLLRFDYGFSGYIHTKIIPGVSQEILHEIGLISDRLSVNIELPSKESLGLLAPQKKVDGIFSPMKQITETLTERGFLRGPGTMFNNEVMVKEQGSVIPYKSRSKNKELFAPAGQTTQMIIGASAETDRQIVKISQSLYQRFKMKRVYFSAYIPVSDSPLLPNRFTQPPLTREHRLYQADWLLRFYGFTADEIADEKNPFLDLELDPKISWALRNIEKFPIEINTASLEELLRIPGIGTISARRIVRQRKFAAVRFDDLKKIGVVTKRAKFFITCIGRYYGGRDIAPDYIKKEILSADNIKMNLLPADKNVQISMFDIANPALESKNGYLIQSNLDIGNNINNNITTF